MPMPSSKGTSATAANWAALFHRSELNGIFLSDSNSTSSPATDRGRGRRMRYRSQTRMPTAVHRRPTPPAIKRNFTNNIGLFLLKLFANVRPRAKLNMIDLQGLLRCLSKRACVQSDTTVDNRTHALTGGLPAESECDRNHGRRMGPGVHVMIAGFGKQFH